MSHPDYPIPPIPDDPVPYRGTTSFASTRSGRSTWGDITIAGSQSSINLNDLKKSSRHISMQSMVDNLAQEEEWVNNRPPSIPFYPAPYPSHPSTSFVPTQSTSRLVDAHPAHRPFPESNGAARPPPTPLRNKETLDTELRISGFHEILFVGIVVMAQFMCLAGLGQAIAPVKYIASGLGVSSPGEQSWFSAAYSLTTGTFILIAGRWGDILGHKRLFVAGYIFLGIWSGFAGFSAYVHKQIFFDICRAMQGIGSAMLAPNALALLSRAYKPGLKKNLTFALFGAMAPWGFVFGALSGALFAQTTWWPWTFWSYGIAAFALAGASHLIVPTALAKEAQFAGQRQPQRPGFDWTGSVVGVCGLILVNVAWNNGPLYGWGAPHVYFVLIIGLLFLVAFVWVEAHATSPLLPLAAFNGTVVYTMALIGIGWGSFGIWIYYTFRFLQTIRLQTPLTTSLQFTPALLCGLLAAGLTAYLLTHTPVSLTLLLSTLAFLIGQLLTAFQPVHQIYWANMFVAIVIMPFGMDMSFPAATIILSNHMPREHQGLAASLVNTMVNYSISIALGIAGTVEVRVRKGDRDTVEDELWGIRCAWWTGCALAGCGLLLGLVYFVRTMRKDGWKVEVLEGH